MTTIITTTMTMNTQMAATTTMPTTITLGI
jgi:hypothetical protein